MKSNNPEIFESAPKNSFTFDLVGELSPEKLPKYKKCLFDFYLMISNSWAKKNVSKLRNLSAYCGIGIKQLQFQSLVLLATTKKSSSYYDTVIEGLLNYIRFDLCFLNYISQASFTYCSLITVFAMVLMFLLIYFQLLTKRRIFIKVFIIVFASLVWMVENYLMIPMVIYSTVYIQHSIFVTDNYVDVYQQNLEFEWYFGLLFVLQLMLLYVIIVMNTIFNYTSAYSFETAYSRAHSLVSLKQVSFLFFLSIIHICATKVYFLYINIGVGVIMVYNYMYYMPYYSQFDNLIDSGLWMVLSASSTLSIINEFTPQGLETVICLMILLPFIYFLLWTKLNQNLDKRSNLEDDSPYISELKIRKLCYKKKEITEETLQEIRQHFNDCTKKFIEFKLLYIWECNFEIKYSPSTYLAMMKLLKFVFAEKRPDFLERPAVIWTSFPDIECEFFYYKLYVKLSTSNNIKNFSLLKYLKNYLKSNRLDAQACKMLIELIDCNLESEKYQVSEISTKCLNFFKALLVKDSTLSKYLNKYNDDSNYLSQYKNFKEQLFYSTDPNTTSQQDKRRESFIDKLMGFSSEQKIAKMILSGSPADTGKIIYVNRNCLDLLGADSSAEVVGKNFTFLIPKPYDSSHVNILQRFLLFGQKTDLRMNHLVILDLEGYSLEVSLHLSMSFYAQVPYFVVDFVGKSPKECIIFTRLNGEILAFSEELSTVVLPEHNNIDQLLPGVSIYFEKHPPGQMFMYEEDGKHELLKRIEIEILVERFSLVYLYEDISTFHFNRHVHNIPMIFSRQNSYLIKARTRESEGRAKKTSYAKRKIRESSSLAREVAVRVKDNSSRIERVTNFLLYSNRVVVLTLVVMILALSVLEINYSNNQVLCDIMNDLTTIRYSITQFSLNIRSIELLRQKESLYYDQASYAANVNNYSASLEIILNRLKDYSNTFPISERLKDTKITLTKYSSGAYSQEPTNLFQALIEVNGIVAKLQSTDFTDIDSLYYIYLNCFEILFNALVASAYQIGKEMTNSNYKVVEFLQSLKSIMFVPLFVLTVLSIIAVYLLESINRSQWKRISNISTFTFMLVRNKTIERMKKIHQTSEIFDPFVGRRLEIYLSCWQKYALSTLALIVLVGLYYILITFLIEQPLAFIVQLKIDHRYWAGLGRSLEIYTFLWARETLISSKNFSYSSIVQSLIPIVSANNSFFERLEQLRDVNTYVLNQTLSLKSHNLNYFAYLDLLSNSACSVSTMGLCEESLIAKGIFSSIKVLNFDLEFLTQSEYELENTVLVGLEYELYNIVEAITEANQLHENISNEYYMQYTSFFIVATTVFLLVIILFYLLIQRKSINEMKNGLISRNQIILMFQETLPNKLKPAQSTSNKSLMT